LRSPLDKKRKIVQYKGEKGESSMEQSPKRRDIVFRKMDFEISLEAGKTAGVNLEDAQGERTFHEELEIKYFYEGSATLMIGEELIVTQPGDITIANPYEVHATLGAGEVPGKYNLYMVGMDFFARGCADMDLRQTLIAGGIRFRNLVRQNPRLQAILRAVAEEIEGAKPFHRQLIQGMMAEFFALLLRSETQTEGWESPDDSRIQYTRVIVPALLRMQRGYANAITVEELAELCGVSRFYFCRIFKEATGMTAMSYLTQCRLKMADVLLQTTDKKIGEIAWECGFEDESYFGRIYKKHRGQSPREGRRARLSGFLSTQSIAPAGLDRYNKDNEKEGSVISK